MPRIRWDPGTARFRDVETGRFVAAQDAVHTLRYDPNVGRVRDEFGRFVPLSAIRPPAREEWTLASGQKAFAKIIGEVPKEQSPGDNRAWGRWVVYRTQDNQVRIKFVSWRVGDVVVTDELDRVAIGTVAIDVGVAGDAAFDSETVASDFILAEFDAIWGKA